MTPTFDDIVRALSGSRTPLPAHRASRTATAPTSRRRDRDLRHLGTKHNASRSPLLTLPPEIRNAIYELVAATEPLTIRLPAPNAPLTAGASFTQHPLALACRQTYREYSYIRRTIVSSSGAIEVFTFNDKGLQSLQGWLEAIPECEDSTTPRTMTIIHHLCAIPDTEGAELDVGVEHFEACLDELGYVAFCRGFTFERDLKLFRKPSKILPYTLRLEQKNRTRVHKRYESVATRDGVSAARNTWRLKHVDAKERFREDVKRREEKEEAGLWWLEFQTVDMRVQHNEKPGCTFDSVSPTSSAEAHASAGSSDAQPGGRITYYVAAEAREEALTAEDFFLSGLLGLLLCCILYTLLWMMDYLPEENL